jgi:hypothetical protein
VRQNWDYKCQLIVTVLEKVSGKKSRFLKQAAQKLSDSGPGALASETPQTQIKESFLLLFYKKAGLPWIRKTSP